MGNSSGQGEIQQQASAIVSGMDLKLLPHYCEASVRPTLVAEFILKNLPNNEKRAVFWLIGNKEPSVLCQPRGVKSKPMHLISPMKGSWPWTAKHNNSISNAILRKTLIMEYSRGII